MEDRYKAWQGRIQKTEDSLLQLPVGNSLFLPAKSRFRYVRPPCFGFR